LEDEGPKQSLGSLFLTEIIQHLALRQHGYVAEPFPSLLVDGFLEAVGMGCKFRLTSLDRYP
jgi:hypothetical protein